MIRQAIYLADEFPEWTGQIVDVNINGKNGYEVKIENIWYDMYGDDDLRFLDENGATENFCYPPPLLVMPSDARHY